MMQLKDRTDQPSRFIVGIDLGTTNSAVAYVDTEEAAWRVRDLAIPQLVAPSTIEARETLPSFHYEAAEGEFPADGLKLPWSGEAEGHVVGFFARDHGATVPGRLISSAKSWLSHSGVDRTAALLPWHAAADVERLSPVDVSARYLSHMRQAWNHQHPEHPLAEQDVVLTVPASFDEVARELTVEAARRAGLVKLTLVEEPQAAFYAWINAQGDAWESQVSAGQKILVADVGGGTTDFTLIRVRPAEEGKVLFHRVAVGEHLILGGDNLDLALAHHIEQKITGGGKVSPREWGPLLRSCRQVKETLLGVQAPDKLTVSVAGAGSKLIGGARQIEITRQEVIELLVEGFLPRVALEAKPAARRSGFQEFGLPYAPDAAITRYLAAFLSAHRDGAIDQDHVIKLDHDLARPDIVLFNGGFFASPLLRQRTLEVIGSWFANSRDTRGTWAPRVLENERLDLAVSRGAAYYGMVRRGRGVRISGGLAHSYYIGVDAAEVAGEASALCLLPAGIEEGHNIHLSRTFNLLIRQPVEFPLYVSATRTTDAPGALVPVDAEQLTALPPIRTVLHSGRKTTADTVPVNLHARLSEIGTLELWAQEARGERQWRLQFDVRSATQAEYEKHISDAEAEGFIDEETVTPAKAMIRSAFAAGPQKPGTKGPQLPASATPASLVKRLELVTGLSRNEWPTSLMRSFWEALNEVQDGRRLSAEHEIRWLNLVGFCLRPGYGLAVDDWRVAQTWRILPQKLHHSKNEQCRAEWWILWRRIAGGLSAGQQLTLAEPLIAAMKSRLRPAGAIDQPKTSPFQYGPHESAEVWRLLGSLELLKLPVKVELGQILLELLPREKVASVQHAALFAIGRLGSRTAVYGPLNALVAPETAEEWALQLLQILPTLSLDEESNGGKELFPLVQLTRRTDDRYRDVSEQTRGAVLDYLRARGATSHYLQLVEKGGQLEAEEQRLTFGENLPRGLRIE
ncbi:MAG TPA: Hsp70 family protein [Tepidisphaeraceae bacterium]|nr:Hsp70 family protein [Tepidisphaeraceae bacterium]